MNKPTKPSKEPVRLSEDELVALQKGLDSEANEREYTLEESIEFARARRSSWTKVADTRTA